MAVDTTRQLRAEVAHDRSYDIDISPLMDAGPVGAMDREKRAELGAVIGLASKRQKLMADFLRRDAPGRFGVKFQKTESTESLQVEVKAEIPEELKAAVMHGFRPQLSPEGELEVQGVDIVPEGKVEGQAE